MEYLVAILVPLGAFAMIFGIVYLITRENMAMIEKGMNPKLFNNLPAPFKRLKTALLFIGAGLGLLVAYIVDNNLRPANPEPIYFSLLAIGGGIGLLISYSIEKKEMEKHESRKERV